MQLVYHVFLFSWPRELHERRGPGYGVHTFRYYTNFIGSINALLINFKFYHISISYTPPPSPFLPCYLDVLVHCLFHLISTFHLNSKYSIIILTSHYALHLFRIIYRVDIMTFASEELLFFLNHMKTSKAFVTSKNRLFGNAC